MCEVYFKDNALSNTRGIKLNELVPKLDAPDRIDFSMSDNVLQTCATGDTIIDNKPISRTFKCQVAYQLKGVKRIMKPI